MIIIFALNYGFYVILAFRKLHVVLCKMCYSFVAYGAAKSAKTVYICCKIVTRVSFVSIKIFLLMTQIYGFCSAAGI